MTDPVRVARRSAATQAPVAWASLADRADDAAPRHAVPIPARRPATGPATVRRIVLTKLVTAPEDDAQIWDAVIGGRSASPFGSTMGAHSTAWVAHLDAIRRHVVNLSAADGGQYLVELADEAADEAASPLLALEPTLPAEQKKALKTAKVLMTKRARVVERLVAVDTTDPAELIRELRALIEDYLSYVNYLPTATVKGGDPSGHGEGVARGLLNQFEYLCALTKRSAALRTAGDNDLNEPAQNERDLLASATEQVKKTTFGKQLVAAAADTFDPARHPALRTEMVHHLWAMFAAETPGIYAAQRGADPLTVWTAALKNFLHTVRLAYPYGYEFTAMHTPLAQWEGLQVALREAGVVLSTALQQSLGQAITGRPGTGVGDDVPALDAVEPAQRGLEQYAEVADSDLFGGGAGFTVTVLMSGPQVGSVEMTGRTQSPFSATMGAHTTAWAAVEDALRARVVNKSLPDAIAALVGAATAALTDHRLDLSHLIDEKQQHHLALAHTELEGLLAHQPAMASDQSRIGFLETLVVRYLTYTNLLPLATLQSGGVPGGRSEGRARTFLLAFEANGIAEIPDGVDEVGYVTERLLALFDPGGLELFPPELGHREEFPHRDHALHDRFTDDSAPPSAEEIHAMAVAEFYDTVQLAYPKAVEFIAWELDREAPELPMVLDTGPKLVRTDSEGGGMKRARPDSPVTAGNRPTKKEKSQD